MSLRLKMILGIGAILVSVILVYALVALRHQAKYQHDLARHQAELIAAVADRALARAMGLGETEAVQAILSRIGEHDVLAGIRIIDPDGRVRRSSLPGEIGRTLRRGPHAGSASPPQPVWDFQAGWVGVFRPILNGPPCAGCHAADREILGYLNVLVSFPALDADLSYHWSVLILAAVVSFFATGALIAAFFSFSLGRRLDLLSATMSRVEAGDLSARVEDAARDELGRLGKSFNAMVERLAEARRQLEDRHAEQIRRAQSLAALGTMAAGIAHEINNPIAGMQNCVRSLLKGTRDEARSTLYLEMLREGLERIGRTVGQLLNFAREAKPQVARIRLTPLLQRCLTLLEHELSVRGITAALQGEEVADLLADQHQLEQVFLNICMNAIEAMPNGGRLDIEVRQRRDPHFVQVALTDTGAGIPPENLSRIFDPFFTTKEVGTGLGLSVSYGIVRAHGGYIDVESTVGRGTTVRVDLPVNGG
ncbi:MAG: sensor histidine kinase [Candidatus Methylomirabilales bacterium]